MNREWELGAGSIIPSDSVTLGCRAPRIFNNSGGSEGDVLGEAVRGDSSGGALGVRDTEVKGACEENEGNCFMN